MNACVERRGGDAFGIASDGRARDCLSRHEEEREAGGFFDRRRRWRWRQWEQQLAAMLDELGSSLYVWDMERHNNYSR